MTTKERLELEIERLEKEQNEIIEASKNITSIEFLISLGKQADKNEQLISFARATLRLK